MIATEKSSGNFVWSRAKEPINLRIEIEISHKHMHTYRLIENAPEWCFRRFETTYSICAVKISYTTRMRWRIFFPPFSSFRVSIAKSMMKFRLTCAIVIDRMRYVLFIVKIERKLIAIKWMQLVMLLYSLRSATQHKHIWPAIASSFAFHLFLFVL